MELPGRLELNLGRGTNDLTAANNGVIPNIATSLSKERSKIAANTNARDLNSMRCLRPCCSVAYTISAGDVEQHASGPLRQLMDGHWGSCLESPPGKAPVSAWENLPPTPIYLMPSAF